MTINITLFSRSDCSLCDQAIQDFKELQSEIPHNLMIVDIDSDDALKEAYTDRVPVVETGKYILEAPFDINKLRMTLGAARDSADQKAKKIGKKRYNRNVKRKVTVTKGDRISLFISKKYLLILNILVFFYVGLSFLAPVLMKAGLPGLAKPIYTVYSGVCHQLAFRSWFLFGDQEAYPRSAANVDGLVPYGEATGLDEGNLWEARAFRGNESVGYKVAFCERDVAIYAAMLLFGLLYWVTKERIPALPWYLWLIIGMGPIGLDGFSQLFSQIPNFPFWPYRESTPFLRTLTGGIFGFTTAWFGYPLVKETMEDTRVMVATKINRLKKQARMSEEK